MQKGTEIMVRLLTFIKSLLLAVLATLHGWWKDLIRKVDIRWRSKFPYGEKPDDFVALEHKQSSNEEMEEFLRTVVPEHFHFPDPYTLNIFQPMAADAYNAWFHSPQSTPDVFVDPAIWGLIKNGLPANYGLPHSQLLMVFDPMKGDSYDSIFEVACPVPHVFVNPEIWDKVKESLPPGYTLPNRAVHTVFQPMRGDHYDSLLSDPMPAPYVFVDLLIWNGIMASLPDGYTLSDPVSKKVLEQVQTVS